MKIIYTVESWYHKIIYHSWWSYLNTIWVSPYYGFVTDSWPLTFSHDPKEPGNLAGCDFETDSWVLTFDLFYDPRRCFMSTNTCLSIRIVVKCVVLSEGMVENIDYKLFFKMYILQYYIQ